MCVLLCVRLRACLCVCVLFAACVYVLLRVGVCVFVRACVRNCCWLAACVFCFLSGSTRNYSCVGHLCCSEIAGLCVCVSCCAGLNVCVFRFVHFGCLCLRGVRVFV